ncbi:hypothetical protein [Meridianimarinicoccus roseus]|uniref:hypothetical protein n=1 Tax=Meridianimarinicoccus roseus TaxID=2072018 RepID=UPI001EE6766C|nr:hypothetical protein [Meridianimarinicoccus roseus]
MRFHPALFMLIVWAGALSAFLLLPFQLTHRSISLEGVLLLMAFLAMFCLGGLLRTVKVPQRPVQHPSELDTSRADLVLKAVCLIACLTMGLEVIRGGALNLGFAYSSRSDQAQAMLHGALSESSSIFKLGFICYPAGYVFLVRELLLKSKPDWTSVVIFGVLPGVFAGLAMGGRAPLFNTMAYGFLAYRARPILWGLKQPERASKPRRIHPAAKVLAVMFGVLAFNYFINVFIIRAEVVGGAEWMLHMTATQWGVTFAGPRAELMIDILGPTTTYLVFVFTWYLIQGIVMSNSLFTTYEGGALMGVYGIDILTAVIRRFDPSGVADAFNYMLGLDTYGFLPSAFGTLYVDYLYGGLFVAFVWGWLATVVYRNTRLGRDARWFLFAPFITLGIVFSLVNTPIGFSNGFITHFWLVVAFFLIRRRRVSRAGVAAIA